MKWASPLSFLVEPDKGSVLALGARVGEELVLRDSGTAVQSIIEAESSCSSTLQAAGWRAS